MKISEFPTDEAFDLIVNITPHARAITADGNIAKQLEEMAKLSKQKDKTKAQLVVTVLDHLWDFVPILFQTHRADFYAILAAVNKVTAEDIAAQPLATTLGQIKDAIKDPELMQLFT